MNTPCPANLPTPRQGTRHDLTLFVPLLLPVLRVGLTLIMLLSGGLLASPGEESNPHLAANALQPR